MKIRVLFYKAKLRDGHWLDDAINIHTSIFNFPRPRLNLKEWWQKIKEWRRRCYSHVELWVQDEAVPWERRYNVSGKIKMAYYGPCYTSTMRGETKGVVKRSASDVLKHPERWDYIEIEVDKDDYEDMIDFAGVLVRNRAKYSFKTVLSFFLPWRINPINEYICSEFVYALLWYGNIFTVGKPKCPSPRRLSRWLTKKGYEIKPLSA